jgi:hypothetical protein
MKHALGNTVSRIRVDPYGTKETFSIVPDRFGLSGSFGFRFSGKFQPSILIAGAINSLGELSRSHGKPEFER